MGGFSSFSIEPYQGAWGRSEAAHLLRRTTYGSGEDEIGKALELGLSSTLDELLATLPLPDPPVNAFDQNDPLVPIGDTWVYVPYSRVENTNKLINDRLRSLAAWTVKVILEEDFSIREKMTLFWYNHFVTSNIRDATFRYRNITNYRENFLGNFKELAKVTTIDPAMLRYLNGNQNTRNRPNENYARELLELFTIGKGPLAGEGDYTNYTEDDILAISKILTGWRDTGYIFRNDSNVDSVFVSARHDKTTKILSHRFNSVEIPNMESNEYSHLIDIIFQQDEVARFIARKIYRWFVYYDLNEQVEAGIIEPMARTLRENNYEMLPMVRTLLQSEHFYDAYAIGAMIKNPIDLVLGSIKQLKVEISGGLTRRYRLWQRLGGVTELLQMQFFNAPTVAGWKAYYQPPLYYRTWINSTTLSNRLFFTTAIIAGVDGDGVPVQADLLSIVDHYENAGEPVELIDYLTDLFLPKEISQSQKEYLKSILIPGLPDYEWTIEYAEYKANPDDTNLKNAVENRLKAMFAAMFSLPEYQLS